jgi:hypothetical protein
MVYAGWTLCVGESQLLAYKYVLLPLYLIEQPFRNLTDANWPLVIICPSTNLLHICC